MNEGDTLVYLMTNENNEHWWLAEDVKGQVGYVPATYLKIITDVTRQEEESDTVRKEGYGKKTDGTKIGGEIRQDGERRKTYSAAMIEGFKRNSAIYVGDSIVRKTDSRLNKGEDVVVCLLGARIEHVTERVEKIMGRGKGGSLLVHIRTILSITVKEKDLGVTMNANMNVSEQCRIAASKGNQVIGMIRRNITYKDKSLILPLYKAIGLVRPHLEYCIQAWSPYLRKDIDMLEKIQRRATKLIPGLRDLRYEERLKECGLTTLETRRLRGDQIEVFKILNGYENIDSNIFLKLRKVK